jgi:hypothetical protein
MNNQMGAVVNFEELSEEQLTDQIRYVYSLGYAKGLTDNLSQWEQANKPVFENFCKSVADFYRDLTKQDELPVKDVYYKCDAYMKELDLLVIIEDSKFEASYTSINRQNIDLQNILGSKFGFNINIRCMSDRNMNNNAIEIDYPAKVSPDASTNTAR